MKVFVRCWLSAAVCLFLAGGVGCDSGKKTTEQPVEQAPAPDPNAAVKDVKGKLPRGSKWAKDRPGYRGGWRFTPRGLPLLPSTLLRPPEAELTELHYQSQFWTETSNLLAVGKQPQCGIFPSLCAPKAISTSPGNSRQFWSGERFSLAPKSCPQSFSWVCSYGLKRSPLEW